MHIWSKSRCIGFNFSLKLGFGGEYTSMEMWWRWQELGSISFVSFTSSFEKSSKQQLFRNTFIHMTWTVHVYGYILAEWELKLPIILFYWQGCRSTPWSCAKYVLFHLQFTQLKKKTKENKKLMHSYLPFKNVPWVEIIMSLCSRSPLKKKIQLNLAQSLVT